MYSICATRIIFQWVVYFSIWFQNAGRIIRGLFEIVLRRGWPVMATRFLTLCRSVDRQLWAFQHPLRQFEKHLGHEVLRKLEGRKMDIHRLKDMSADEIGK